MASNAKNASIWWRHHGISVGPSYARATRLGLGTKGIKWNTDIFSLSATLPKTSQTLMFLHIAGRVWGRRGYTRTWKPRRNTPLDILVGRLPGTHRLKILWVSDKDVKNAVWAKLTHWGRDKMDAVSQTTFWNAFSWMKMHEIVLSITSQSLSSEKQTLVQVVAWYR